MIATTASGPGIRNESISNLILYRESGMKRSRHSSSLVYKNSSPCSSLLKTHLTQRFLPTKSTIISRSRDAIFCGLFSKDGTLYTSACKDGQIRIYDTLNWKKVKSISARDVGWSIISTDYSPDQKWMIYSSWSPYIHLTNIDGQHEDHEALDMRPTASRFCLFSIQFSSDSKEIIGGSSDRSIYIYDLERKERVHKIPAHDDDINAVAFMDKSNQIFLSGSDDCTIKVWDRRTCTTEVGLLTGHNDGITFIDPKGDGTYLISNSKDQKIKLWDIRKMKDPSDAPTVPQRRMRARRTVESDNSVMSYEGHTVAQTLIRCRFSPLETTGQKYIYSGSYDGVVYVYDLITGEIVHTLRGNRNVIRDVHWHPTQPIIVSAGWNGTLCRWEHTDEAVPVPTPQLPNPQRRIPSYFMPDDD
eukprot:TRINITY_DN216_c1_g3_i1.p1 TRINITY_DN216_c1_g3~~TRINITY_DN216_c1_g3_i1.p1  ORF type:complete len:474 (+),score=62.65 TRINITY_DN216_c1_g3_i1:177-1424(+)